MTTRAEHPSTRLGERIARLSVRVVLALVVVVLTAFAPAEAGAQVNYMPRELRHVGVNEHLDAALPLDTPFRDHTGKAVRLGDFWNGGKPVVLTFAYHSCPVLCGMVLNNAAAGLKGIPWRVGKEFDIVTISIDPEETLEKTAAKRTSLLREYGRAADEAGWHFLVGDKESIAKVAAAAGFEYEYDARQGQWGHPSVVMLTTPEGKMARYLYGIEFPPADLRIGLLEASQGRSISTVEKLILYCYHYDPQGGKYVLVARRVMQVGGGAVALVLFGLLGLFWMRELKKKIAPPARESKESNDGEPGGPVSRVADTAPNAAE